MPSISFSLVFESVVVIAFQNAFHSKTYANNVFLFFKNYFWDQHIKMIWKHKKHINSKQKKKFQIFWKTFLDRNAKHIKLGTIVLRPGPVQGPGSGFWPGLDRVAGSAGSKFIFLFFIKKIKTTSF